MRNALFATHCTRQRHRAVLDESPGDVRGGPVRAEIFRGDETFLDPAVQTPERAHFLGRLAHGPMPAADHDGERGAEVDHEPDRESPVEHGEHDNHAGDHQCGAERLGHDETQELRHRRDVAVDALDQFARRVPPMELVVEPEHVAGHVESKLVGRGPRRGRRPPGDEHGQHLSHERDHEEDPGERVSSSLSAPAAARSTRRRMTSGPAITNNDDAATSSPSAAHRTRSGHRSAPQRAPPGLRSCCHADSLPMSPRRERERFDKRAPSAEPCNPRDRAPAFPHAGGIVALSSMLVQVWQSEG